jgi:hypothetical protein
VIDAEGGLLLNTCTSEALVQLLRHLKRAYWPYQWDTALDHPAHGVHGSGGGFAAAAENALGMAQMDAYTQALSRTAKHRLDRGIWTSTGISPTSLPVPGPLR